MTNKDKATARPWKSEIDKLNTHFIKSSEGEIIAVVNEGISNTLQNTKLIVKAVNMHDKLISTLETIKTDCKMALSGDWDRSDEGFQAIIESINAVLKE